MKKQKIFLKNKQLLGFYLVVGVLFSVISVVAPSISGELVNAVIYRQGDVKIYLFLLVLTYILLLLFSIADISRLRKRMQCETNCFRHP